jgi:glycosyltransferase involved in cell wall biosynthesis
LSPRITVIMPVYNAAPYVAEAARSILSSSFRELELLAINDGSTDDSEATLRSIADHRLRIISNPVNVGVVKTLNRGLDLAEGEFVARMDADDISMPKRLAQQLAFMEANPQIGVCGTWVTTFGDGPKRVLRGPLTPAEIHARLFGFNALSHPTVILRRSFFLRHGLRYAVEAVHAEDLDLWMRAAECFPLANIPVAGLRYRVHANQIANRYAIEEQETVDRLRMRQLALLLPGASDAEIALHLSMFDVAKPVTHSELVAVGGWLARLEDANEQSQRYDLTAFRSFLAERWLNAAYRCAPPTVQTWHTWRHMPFATVGVAARLRLRLKIALKH